MAEGTTLIPGLVLHRGHLGRPAQEALVAALRTVATQAPFVRPMTAWGKPMSVRMTSAGRLGWVIDRGRYAYVPRHPGTGCPWPAIPAAALALWRAFVGTPAEPDCCLINWYAPGARMGLHRDADEGEAAFGVPVLSVSLGEEAVFRYGGPERRDPTRSFRLRSGDVLVMGGPARLIYHGVDRIVPGTSDLLPDGGRINITLRAVADD
ncbi:MAG: alpha-ketoglutarate-dependent dioxygenase AlkB [Pseudomonadota bacterium]